MTSGRNDQGRFIPSGFVVTLVQRLLTSSLVIVIPLFVSVVLGLRPSQVGVIIIFLWLGNSFGVVVAVAAITRQSTSSMVGFTFLATATAGMGFASAESLVAGLTFAAGVGMGMAQPFTPGLMHLDSSNHNPFEGLGLYSVALGLGLVLGPLLAALLVILYGFAVVFIVLSLLSLSGVVASFMSRKSRVDKSVQSPISLRLTLKSFANRTFTYSFLANLAYSFTLPIYLSFSAIYAQSTFGLAASTALVTLSVVFGISVAARAISVGLRSVPVELLFASVLFLLSSLVVMGFAESSALFIVGMLLFSIPHAFVFPMTNFYALGSVEKDLVMNASYAFQWSSGVAEFVTPALAVGMIPRIGIGGLFLVMVPLGIAAAFLTGMLATRRG